MVPLKQLPLCYMNFKSQFKKFKKSNLLKIIFTDRSDICSNQVNLTLILARDWSLLLVHLVTNVLPSGTIYIQGCGHRLSQEEWECLAPLERALSISSCAGGPTGTWCLLGDDNFARSW